MSLVFVDTQAWMALLKRDDCMHVRARRYYEGKVQDGTRFLTTNYVTDKNREATPVRRGARVGSSPSGTLFSGPFQSDVSESPGSIPVWSERDGRSWNGTRTSP